MKKRRSMTTGRKRRNAPTAARRRKRSTADANEKIALLTRERDEALEQQTATSDVLRVISSSPGELEPVFEAMLQNATRICEANFGNMFLYEHDAFRTVAMQNAPPAYSNVRAGKRRIFEARRLAEDPITLADLAAEFGVSRERVRQIDVSSLEKVRKAVKYRGATIETLRLQKTKPCGLRCNV